MKTSSTFSQSHKKAVLSALSAGGFSLREFSPVLVDAVRVSIGRKDAGKLIKQFKKQYNSAKEKYATRAENAENEVKRLKKILNSADIYSAADVVLSRSGIIGNLDDLVIEIENSGKEFIEQKLKTAIENKETYLKQFDALGKFEPDDIICRFSDKYREYLSAAKEKAAKEKAAKEEAAK